jgi:phosphotriesterase-related protein
MVVRIAKSAGWSFPALNPDPKKQRVRVQEMTFETGVAMRGSDRQLDHHHRGHYSGPGSQNERGAMTALTVRGAVPASDLGITDIHEHILCDLSRNFEPTAAHPELRDARVTLETLGLLTHNPLAIPDNLVLSDEALAVKELAAYRRAGIGTVVDLTTEELGRNPLSLRRISEATGIHIITCTGQYIHSFLPEELRMRSVEQLEETMSREITVGIGETGVRAGIIGELGTSERIYPEEETSLRAAAHVNRLLGVPLMVHTDPQSRMAPAALSILESAGADLGKVSICHLDSAFFEPEYYEAILATGASIEFDTFGENFCLHPNYGPSDLDRIKALCRLLERGYVRQIMLGCDVCLKCRLHEYGGWGYDHLLTNVVPAMVRLGIGPAELDTMLRDNPREYLAF